MWRFVDNGVIFDPSNPDHVFSGPLLIPEWPSFEGFLVSTKYEGDYQGYDDWIGHFPRVEEHHSVRDAISHACAGMRVHIRGISTYESVELLREYYRDKGYEDILAKNYIIPGEELLTASISLPHALWCEKDKLFLGKKKDGLPYGEISPPVRSPADLRSLQQALRMGIIIGLEVPHSHYSFLPDLLSKQILTLYQLGFLLSRGWSIHGVKTQREEFSFPVPHFPIGEQD